MALHYILVCLLATATVAFAQGEPEPEPELEVTYDSSTEMIMFMNDRGDGASPVDPNVTTRLINYFEGEFSDRIRRDQHHYCLGSPIEVMFENPNRSNEIVFVETMENTPFPEENNEVWSLFFQYPVLSYIDTSRKDALLYLIASLANETTPNTLDPPFEPDNICLGAFETYAVSQYDEGFLMRIYLDGQFVTSMVDDVSDYINLLHENFVANIDRVADDDSDPRAQRFRGRSALYIPASPDFDIRDSNPGNNFHPGSTLSPDEDPTLFAVFRGSWPHNLTDSENQEGVGIASRMARSAASNPNPINYGLEAGDIVFAVIGSIFLFIMAALIVLGYFIHPFFLS